jgi:hypothetical protein
MINRVIILFSLVYLSTSCTPYLYTPNAANMPLPDSKNEFKGLFYCGNEGLGFQSSYALDSHILIMGNGSIRNPSTYQIDIGGGYHKKFNPFLKFEILGGGRYGQTSDYTSDFSELSSYIFGDKFNEFEVDGHFIHAFLQADMGIKEQNDEMDFGLRISDLSMQENYFSNSYNDSGNITNHYQNNFNGNALFLEPSFQFLTGSKKVKFKIGGGYSIKLFGPNVDLN